MQPTPTTLIDDIEQKLLSKTRYVLVLEAVCIVALACCFLLKPSVFPMHGFSGPDSYAPPIPGTRLTGDSWRYISGGQAFLENAPFDNVQQSYSGYCVLNGLLGPTLIPMQIVAAIVALWAIFAFAYSMDGPLTAIAASAIFALNPEFAAWHTAVMTESFYISAVCINAWLVLKSIQKPNWKTAVPIVAFITLTAFIRPTGWIQLPAVLILFCCLFAKKYPLKLALSALVAILFVALATTLANKNIQKETPTAKLYAGEVVWQEELWKVSMPEPDDASDITLAAGVNYALQHPVASTWLALKRLGVMFLRIRPSYSLPHNAFLILFHLPVAALGIAALILWRKKPEIAIITTMTLAHALIVALTFNDNDGRFTLYFTPLLAIAATMAVKHGLLAVAKRFIHNPFPKQP